MSFKSDKKKNIKSLDNVFKIIEEKEDIVETEEEKNARLEHKKEVNKIKSILIILVIGILVLIGLYTMFNVIDNVNGKYSELKFRGRNETIVKGVDDTLLQNYLQKGKYTIVTFWASWCSHCKNEASVLDKFMIANKDINFIVVSHDKNVEDLKEYLSKNSSYKWFILYDKERAIRKSIDPSANSVPMTFLLDDQGNVIDRIDGEATFDELTALYEKSKIQPKK